LGNQLLGRFHVRLKPESPNREAIPVALRLDVDATDRTVAPHDRIDIVPILPFGFRDEDLDPVVEAEQPFSARAVAKQRIKRAEDPHAVAGWCGLPRLVDHAGKGKCDARLSLSIRFDFDTLKFTCMRG